MRIGCLCLLLVALTGCAPADYPGAWPRPALVRLDGKGDCPNLSGDYDKVNSELSWLLSGDTDFQKPRAAWREHRVRISQAEDGSWLLLEFSLNEHGLAELRERSLKFNQQQVGGPHYLRLREGEQYECSDGWLYNLLFPQQAFERGMKRVSMRLGRDRDGGLIAGARLLSSQSLGWGDATGIAIWDKDETRWYRWPPRPPEADLALAAAQSVALHRFGWVNHGLTVPTRFTSFHVEPICLRYEDTGVMTAPSGPEPRRPRDAIEPEAAQCPDGWGKFDAGEVLRREMLIPDQRTAVYRFEWFVLREGESAKHEIRIDDVRDLPLLPGERRDDLSRVRP